MRVFFWQNMPSHIQTGALDHFASIWPGGATGVWVQDISSERKALGWSADRTKHLENIVLPKVGWERKVNEIVGKSQNDIHILSGIGSYPPITLVANILRKIPNPKLGLIVEPVNNLGWKGPLRRLKARWSYFGFKGLISVVLAIGKQGRDFYLSIGFKDEQIFPYLYQCPFGRTLDSKPPTGKIGFVYVGQLQYRKGVDILLRAILPFRDRTDWNLTLIGQGNEEPNLRRFVLENGLSNHVSFLGAVPANQVVSSLAMHDVCCVPSRFDGWGMATNEALQAGLPAIVSSSASSSDLVRFSRAGRIFQSGNIEALSSCFSEYLEQPELIDVGKRRASVYSIRISPEVVAAYMKNLFEAKFLLKNQEILAPWTVQQEYSESKGPHN